MTEPAPLRLAWIQESPGLSRTAWYIWAAACVVLILIPLVIQLSRPMAFHDYLGEQLNGSHPDRDVRKIGSVAHNLKFDYWQNQWNFRPVSNLVYNLCYCLFGGEFWLFDLMKWGMKLLAAYWLFATLRAWGPGPLAGLCGASFFLFHVTCFESQTLAADPILAFFLVACFYVISRESGPFCVDLAAWGWGKFLAFLAAFVLMLGSKEPAAALAVAFLVVFLVATTYEWVGVVRLAVLAGTVLVHCYLILRPALGKLKEGAHDANGSVVQRLHDMVMFSLGAEIKTYAFFMLLGLLLFGAYRSFRTSYFRPFATVLLAFGAVTLFNGIPVGYPPNAWPRYAIPGSALLGLLVGLSLSRIGRWQEAACTVFLLVYPLYTGQNILENHIRLVRLHKECNTLLNAVVNKEREGFSAYYYICSDPSFKGQNIYPEEVDTLRNFFGLIGRDLFHGSAGEIHDLAEKPSGQDRFTLFTGLEYSEMDPALTCGYEVTVLRFPAGQPGFPGKLSQWLGTAGKWLGRSKEFLILDRDGPPRLKLFVFRKSDQTRFNEVPVTDISYGSIAH